MTQTAEAITEMTIATGGADLPEMITITQGNALSPQTMMMIGTGAIIVGLILTIIAAIVISKALKGKSASSNAASAPVSFSPQATAQAGDPQLIAAITAALMAYGVGGNGSGKLVVRSIRRVNGASAWANAGRREQINY